MRWSSSWWRCSPWCSSWPWWCSPWWSWRSAPRGGGGAAPRGGGAPRGAPPAGRGGRGGGAPPPTPAAPPKPKCRALYPYDPVEPDELTLNEGDVIEIIEQDGDWWKGLLNGAESLFPANYVEMC